MDTLEVIQNASRSAREQFEKKVSASGLKVEKSREGFVIYASENPQTDVEGVLKRNGIDFERYGSGTYIASCFPAVKKAVEEGLGMKITSSPSFQSIH